MTIKKMTIFLVLWMTATTASAQEAVSLEQAKQLAINRNASLAALREGVEAARAREGRAASGFYPVVETRVGTEQTLQAKDKPVSTFGYVAAVWNVYRGGQDVAGTKTASLEAKKVQLDFDRQRLMVESEVETAFSNLLYLRDVRKIKERFLEINSQQQKLARQIVSRGGGSQSDVMEFDLRQATLKSDILTFEQDYRGYLIRLKALIGADISLNPSPTGELPHQHVVGALADYVNPTLSATPQVKAAALGFDIASHKAIAAKGRWLPQVDVEARLGALPVAGGGGQGELGSSVAVVATWEIFGGFDATHEVQERAAARNQADFALQGEITALLADVQSRFGDLETIQNRTDLEKDNIKTTKKYYDLVFEDFKRGYKNSTDFSAAAASWYDAEVQRKRLDLEFIEKKVALEMLLGRRIATTAMRDVDAREATHEQ